MLLLSTSLPAPGLLPTMMMITPLGTMTEARGGFAAALALALAFAVKSVLRALAAGTNAEEGDPTNPKTLGPKVGSLDPVQRSLMQLRP